jgi:NodT family efflux transporter outer membrane factor (OMF) lipoprotein
MHLTEPQVHPGLPSELLARRPDVAEAEADLIAANANIKVARASFFPSINLTASGGYESAALAMALSPASKVFALTAGITQPIFDAGALSAKKRAAVAAFDQANAQYRSTVLSAFQDVADSLQALDFDAKTLKQQVEVEQVARQTLDLTGQQFKLGAINSLALLDAKRTYQSARIALVQAQAARYADTAALFQSLGGGWWNRPELKDISVKSE